MRIYLGISLERAVVRGVDRDVDPAALGLRNVVEGEARMRKAQMLQQRVKTHAIHLTPRANVSWGKRGMFVINTRLLAYRPIDRSWAKEHAFRQEATR